MRAKTILVGNLVDRGAALTMSMSRHHLPSRDEAQVAKGDAHADDCKSVELQESGPRTKVE